MKKLLTTIVLAGFCSVACAQEATTAKGQPSVFGYNYVEGSFVSRQDSGNGFNLNASVDVASNWAAIGDLTFTSKNDVDHSDLRLGVAYHQQIVPEHVKNLDLVVRGQVQSLRDAWRDNDNNEFGLVVGGGVRYWAIPKLEVFGDADFATVGDSVLTLSGGARYHIIDQLVGFGKVSFSNDSAIAAGLRFQF